MEQDRFPRSGPDPGLCGCDRDLFQRVWKRVMPEEREGCPIETVSAREALLPLPAPPPAADRMQADFPAENDVPCLGAASAMYGELLQEFISGELADWRMYHALARRAGAFAARTLSGIAAEELRHARRLSAAYFLISGLRFFPERMPVPAVESYLGALRQRFVAEQRGEAAYLAAAAETADRCLYDLYLELAEDEAEHRQLVRGILEQL